MQCVLDNRKDDRKDGRKYVQAKQRTREQTEKMLLSADAEQIREALWSATYYDPDWRWVQGQCLFFLTHTDLWVRRNAATCLGLLAVFHNKLDVEVVIPALERAAQEAEVKPFAEDSLADIRHVMGTTKRPSDKER
jgi:hypothetical protein